MKLTENFQVEEFRCSHCGKDGVKIAVPEALEKLRALIGKPIMVNSGYRCAQHPVEAAKVTPGQHTKGLAADIHVEGMTPRELYTAARTIPDFHGFGVADDDGYIHLDLRAGPTAHWCYKQGHEVPWHEAIA